MILKLPVSGKIKNQIAKSHYNGTLHLIGKLMNYLIKGSLKY